MVYSLEFSKTKKTESSKIIRIVAILTKFNFQNGERLNLKIVKWGEGCVAWNISEMSGLDEVVEEVFSSKMCSYGNMKLKDLLAF